MLTFIIFLLLAGITSYLFEMVAGFIFGIPLLIYIAFTQENEESFLVNHPVLVFIVGVFNHALIGALYAFVIFSFSLYFINHYEGNFWLYCVFSILWSLVPLSRITGFLGVFFVSCTLGIICLWFLGLTPFLILLAGNIIFNFIKFLRIAYA